MNLKKRKSFLFGAGIVVVLGLIACLLTNPPRAQKAAASNLTLNATNDPSASVPISEYNKLVEAANQMALVVSNLQAAAIHQQQELTNLYAKMAEFDLRANGQEDKARTFTESCSLLETDLSQTLNRVDAMQRAVIKLSLGMQELQSRTKPVPTQSSSN
jgi:predicted RNase H-like nuclease (RuvC/YqgF family)